MTIAKITRRFSNSGDGVSVDFFFSARFFADSDIDVVVLDASDIETTKVLDVDYTVSNTGTEAGGTVTFIIAPLSTDTVTLIGDSPRIQSTDYTDNDAFPAETHEAALDYLTILAQENGDLVDRALVLPPSSTSDPLLPTDDNRKGKLLGFDAAGDPVMYDLASELGTAIVPKSFTGDGVTVDFVLSVIPASKIYTIVTNNGVTQEQETYSVSGSTLTFSEAPPNGSSIQVLSFSSTDIINIMAVAVGTDDGSNVQTKLDDIALTYDFNFTTNTHPDVRETVFANLSGTAASLYRIGNVEDVRLSGSLAGTLATGFSLQGNGPVDGFFIQNMDIEASGFAVVLKPSTGTNGWTENGVFYGNNIRGGATTADLGVSLDGDARNIVSIGNIITDIQRSDDARDAHAFAVAGNDGDIPVNDSHNIIFGYNVIDGIAGNAFHFEDNVARTGTSFNVARDIKTGIETINDSGALLQLHVGNFLAEFTEYAINVAGSGTSKSSGYWFNIMDGAGATQANTHAVRLGQSGTKNINYVGNIHYDFTTGGFYSNARGPLVVTHNVFEDIATDGLTFDKTDVKAVVAYNALDTMDYGIVGSATTTDREVLVESNNFFSGMVTEVVEKANSATLIGDQIVVSGEMDGQVASDDVMFVAQRDGWVTGVSRVYTSAGGGGTLNGTFTIYGGATTIFAKVISRVGVLYGVTTWGSENTDIVANKFSAGDVIRVESDGAADASTLCKVQLEFFYYS